MIPKLHKPLLALSLALPLAAFRCGADEVRTTPPAARFERVDLPVQPMPEAKCADGPCLSDRQAGHLLDEVIDALCEANDRLAWLSDYYLGTKLEASCGAESGGY